MCCCCCGVAAVVVVLGVGVVVGGTDFPFLASHRAVFLARRCGVVVL